ncbi:MAG: nuclear transport factor 2 family protein [Ignavibacteriae bacterium]|nr:nuclear transport factor 2 family protein [Ignavibacteriota bacterium]
MVNSPIVRGASLMKLGCPLILGVLLVACGQVRTPEKETEAIKQTLFSFFDAISNFDYAALQSSCTSEYVLIEDGATWNIDSLIHIMKGLQESKLRITYSFHNIDVRIEGNIAWMTYENVGILSAETGADTLRWVESALFRKEQSTWRMALLHSTRIRQRR